MEDAKLIKQSNSKKTACISQEEGGKAKSSPSDLTECLLTCLNQREQDVLKRRYALHGGRKETLEAIGENYQITRERVRQIERASLSKIKKLVDYRNVLKDLVDEIDRLLARFGGIIGHDHLVEELARLAEVNQNDQTVLSKERNHLFFLLEQFVSDIFHFHGEGEDHNQGWSKDKDIIKPVKQILERIEDFLAKHAKPITHEEIATAVREPEDSVYSYLNLSNRIKKNAFGLWGMSRWPAINPKRMADRIYLVLTKYAKPMHYRDIAGHIEQHYGRKTHPPTVHNELIADDRFVLVGRGIYALKEWGYVSGTVREVVESVLAKSAAPLTREEIIEAVQKQRLVARSTILLALNNNSHIKRAAQDRYTVDKTNN
ncbi:MAG: hypothetical protein A2445_04790 [Candidatus Jacksonbacteria bacterium RIFOXYC2_FULL_44_29]|nr:MAG: RNA polymerase sigma factor [Parcubacteria group bacterium GW2011_GWC2_44_22]OGY75177.1 MAG: hypothetical protein A2240_01075 [Candidatus Jacksonbacteria bacterium RIFOXYA2_FULL_43_12]OGY75640.1 MAG: hypothetical protein A2295_04670 [Candidatus Jacksonbacteria bacterium RIFOXYB2_FULL_44_15]OGY77784.1 MAG: hypothetical protein A2445_04790 [Candidatus Jacksonbacteria bacterium RIFOXYC2_FULL_44_29]OGY79513.1 MAG: hypothetical protein A2550_02080 [Candidatus Jacksonbacteria bacterium RIFOXY